jgi:hypothetical protein
MNNRHDTAKHSMPEQPKEIRVILHTACGATGEGTLNGDDGCEWDREPYSETLSAEFRMDDDQSVTLTGDQWRDIDMWGVLGEIVRRVCDDDEPLEAAVNAALVIADGKNALASLLGGVIENMKREGHDETWPPQPSRSSGPSM